VAFIEVVDGFKVGDKDITMHWSGVWEINQRGKITARRDYYDSKEYEAQLSRGRRLVSCVRGSIHIS